DEEEDRYPAYPSKYRRVAQTGWTARQTHDGRADGGGLGADDDARTAAGGDPSRYLEGRSVTHQRGIVPERRVAGPGAGVGDNGGHPAGIDGRGGSSNDVNSPPPGSQWNSGGQKGQWRAVSPSNVSRSDIHSPPGPAPRASSAPAGTEKAAGLTAPANRYPAGSGRDDGGSGSGSGNGSGHQGAAAWKPTVGWQMRRRPSSGELEKAAKEHEEKVGGGDERGGGGGGGRETARGDGLRPRAGPPSSAPPSSPPQPARNGAEGGYARSNNGSSGSSGGVGADGRVRDGSAPPHARAAAVPASSPGYPSSPSSRAVSGAGLNGRREGEYGSGSQGSGRAGGHPGGPGGGRGAAGVPPGGAIAVLPPPPPGPGPARPPAHLHQHAEDYSDHRRHHYQQQQQQQQQQAYAAELAERYRQGGKKARFGSGGRAA
ncbi:unnamed protein product, partial [Scytosiphon promiscuus]